jgi:hypothetical protein
MLFFKEKFIFAPICIFLFSVFSINLSSQIQLSDTEIAEILLDEVALNEHRFLQNILVYGGEKARDLSTTEEEIFSLLVEFETTDLTNEELWEALDYLKLNLYVPINEYDEIIENISPKSESLLTYYHPFYSMVYGSVFDLKYYLIRHADLILKMIEALEIADIELYDQYQGRSALLNSEFMSLIADQNEVGLQMSQKQGIAYVMSAPTITISRITSHAMKLGSLLLLEELNDATISSTLREVKELTQILRNYNKREIIKSIDRLKVSQIAESPVIMKKIDKIEAYAFLCFDSQIRTGEAYIAMANLFEAPNYEENYYNLIDPINLEIENSMLDESCWQFHSELRETQDLAINIAQQHKK